MHTQINNTLPKLMSDHTQTKQLAAIVSYLCHDCNGSLSCSFSHLVLNKEEHVLIIEQANEVEGPKACSTT